MGLRKNGLAKLNPAPREWGARARFEGMRKLTEAELRAWYDSPESKGMNSAGETKLPPNRVSVKLEPGTIVTVVRARCNFQAGWARPVPKCAQVLLPSGEIVFVRREFLEEI
jgi:hypothetical protein